MNDEWGEAHGYTNRCAGCGQLTDSTYCSVSCELLDTRRDEANEEDGSDE